MIGRDGKKARPGAPLKDRLLLHVTSGPNGCWLWTAAINNRGYGRIQIDGRLGYSHRAAYECFVGPIPEGLEIDHLCRNRACCNPQHLEAVTPRVNVLRGESVGARALRRTNCLHGHPYEDHGLINSQGRRICRVCRDTYMAIYRATPYAELRRRRLSGELVVDLAAHFAQQGGRSDAA